VSNLRDEAAWRRLQKREIRRVVAEVRARGGILHSGPLAGRLATTYPGTGYSTGRIIDEIIAVAADAGVPVEIGREPASESGGQPVMAQSLSRGGAEDNQKAKR
jgi:hypothetical protein